MAVEIIMPNLGFDAHEAHIVEWLKKPGDAVRKGEVLAIVESDKANVELESIESGTLLEVLYPDDSDVVVGAVIARIGQSGEAAPPRPQTMPAENQRPPAPVPAPPVAAAAVEASPLARRIASDHGLDLAQIQGSGPRGRITREDVEAMLPAGNGHQEAAKVSSNGGNGGLLALPKVRKMARDAGIDLAVIPATGKKGNITLEDLRGFQRRLAAGAGAGTVPQPAAPPPVLVPEGSHEVELSRLQKIAGQRLSQSKQDAPHFYVTGEFDLEDALQTLKDYAAPHPRINDLLQYLVVQTLLKVPQLNATFVDSHLYHHESVNLAVAVARSDGLITPVIQGADRFSLTGLAKESRALIQRTRDNHLQPIDLQNGTFTISNLGMVQQVDHFTAVINPPQVGILAVGTVKPRAVVVNGGLHIRNTVHMTLSGDHRVVDGMILARFMETFQAELDAFSR